MVIVYVRLPESDGLMGGTIWPKIYTMINCGIQLDNKCNNIYFQKFGIICCKSWVCFSIFLNSIRTFRSQKILFTNKCHNVQRVCKSNCNCNFTSRLTTERGEKYFWTEVKWLCKKFPIFDKESGLASKSVEAGINRCALLDLDHGILAKHTVDWQTTVWTNLV